MWSLLYVDTLAQIVADLREAQANGEPMGENTVNHNYLIMAESTLIKEVGMIEAERLIAKETTR